MPNKRRERKNRNNGYQQNDSNKFEGRHHQSNGGGGSGGIQKASHSNGRHHNNHYNGSGQRKTYFNPSVIRALEDEELLQATERTVETNENNYNRRKDYNSKKNNKDQRRKVVEKLKDMGIDKSAQKFSIGDTDDAIKKVFIESRPHCKLSLLSDDVFAMIVNYVQNYFMCFDSNRQALLAAYNQHVTFSLSLNMSNSVAHRMFRFEETLIRENRNLKRIVGQEEHHHEKRLRLLQIGPINALSILLKLPPTEHDPNSFKLDNCFFSPHMISFSLTGVFKEGKPTDKVRPLRSFSRVFVCIPDPNSQMSIINEQFVISNVTTEQYKKYYSQQQQQQQRSEATNGDSAATAPSANANAMSGSDATIAAVDSHSSANASIEKQKLMIQEFSAQSRLNIEWSKHCLEFANWNFEEAAKAFSQFKANIPLDAYI